jgi:hypothetical protein
VVIFANWDPNLSNIRNNALLDQNRTKTMCSLKRAIVQPVLGIRICMFLGLPDPELDPLVRESGSFPFLIKVLSGLIKCLQNNYFNTKFSQKNQFLRLQLMCLQVSKTFFCILKVTEERSRIQSWIRIRIPGTV